MLRQSLQHRASMARTWRGRDWSSCRLEQQPRPARVPCRQPLLLQVSVPAHQVPTRSRSKAQQACHQAAAAPAGITRLVLLESSAAQAQRDGPRERGSLLLLPLALRLLQQLQKSRWSRQQPARRAQPSPLAPPPERQPTVAQLAAHGPLYDFVSFSNVPQWVGMCSTAFNVYRVASESRDSARHTQAIIDLLMLPAARTDQAATRHRLQASCWAAGQHDQGALQGRRSPAATSHRLHRPCLIATVQLTRSHRTAGHSCNSCSLVRQLQCRQRRWTRALPSTAETRV